MSVTSAVVPTGSDGPRAGVCGSDVGCFGSGEAEVIFIQINSLTSSPAGQFGRTVHHFPVGTVVSRLVFYAYFGYRSDLQPCVYLRVREAARSGRPGYMTNWKS